MAALCFCWSRVIIDDALNWTNFQSVLVRLLGLEGIIIAIKYLAVSVEEMQITNSSALLRLLFDRDKWHDRGLDKLDKLEANGSFIRVRNNIGIYLAPMKFSNDIVEAHVCRPQQKCQIQVCRKNVAICTPHEEKECLVSDGGSCNQGNFHVHS